ncbi:zinc-dependent alcohol dehydrogenase family protein [Nordella sp. HKS 07]|uniref:zinc-dependent alcohol dehydrogenase family protein n=1 Tax=Nordella sp. HKS 07 TaxID=2712222 RepID=UPI0013E20118|nr:zinc-dependent alcohol dehydrogenase family protein [Nordella sp. HKS 07]QIG47462.1 zinc-dependent alcohol dehydrogenase family protein [Nordella sp. HKS 07]
MTVSSAMMLVEYGRPLEMRERPLPAPQSGEIRLSISACGVCRTDLHVVDGDLPKVPLPLVPGHEIIGYVEEVGAGVSGLEPGQRVGVPWLGHTCGRCFYCLSEQENLCDRPLFTGYTRDGGYATHTIADARYAFALEGGTSDLLLAPLLCAGLIGWRSLRIAGDGKSLGLYGFGAAAHIITQVAKWQGRRVFAFTRKGDGQAQDFARSHGAEWAGASDETPPELLDAAIIYAPVGALVPQALKAVRKGGRVVCAGIHMSDLPSFPYRLLWEERQILSVANLTRDDGDSFFHMVPQIGIQTSVTPYPLADANRALDDLREGRLQGAAVLTM